MLNKFKKLFTGSVKAQQPAQQQGRERNANGEPLFTEAEAQAIQIARKAVFFQLHMAGIGEEGDPLHKFNQPRHVTPWIIGYMVGVLDYATRCTEDRAHADFDVLRMFYALTFAPELMRTVAATFERAQDALRAGNDPDGDAAQFTAGAKAGYNTHPRDPNGAPQLGLYNNLKGENKPA